jgi:hypothetical protein
MTLGLDVLVQLVMAAITTDPCSTAACGGAATAVPPPPPAFLAVIIPGSACANPCFAALSGTRSCGRFGPARLGSIASRLKSIVSTHRIGGALLEEESLGPRVGFHELDARAVAPAQAQVVERHRIDRKDGDGRAVFRAHVAERGTVGQRQVLEAGTEELHELADHAVLAQPFGDRQDEVGGGGAGR